jgi:hypothetical protein
VLSAADGESVGDRVGEFVGKYVLKSSSGKMPTSAAAVSPLALKSARIAFASFS